MSDEQKCKCESGWVAMWKVMPAIVFMLGVSACCIVERIYR